MEHGEGFTRARHASRSRNKVSTTNDHAHITGRTSRSRSANLGGAVSKLTASTPLNRTATCIQRNNFRQVLRGPSLHHCVMLTSEVYSGIMFTSTSKIPQHPEPSAEQRM